jgi:hypothetical protein
MGRVSAWAAPAALEGANNRSRCLGRSPGLAGRSLVRDWVCVRMRQHPPVDKSGTSHNPERTSAEWILSGHARPRSIAASRTHARCQGPSLGASSNRPLSRCTRPRPRPRGSRTGGGRAAVGAAALVVSAPSRGDGRRHCAFNHFLGSRGVLSSLSPGTPPGPGVSTIAAA